MKTYTQLRAEKETRINALMNELGVFFAFSNKQFDENKTELAEGDIYVRFASGGYIAKSNADALFSGFDAIDKDIDDQITINNLEDDEIEYELANHESWYTGSIDDAMDALGDKYTRERVIAVYRAKASQHWDD